MATFSLNPLRSREPKSKLPVYERFEGKERDSNDSYDDSDYDSDATSSPSTSNSRHTSASVSATPLMARKTLSLPRRAGRPFGYRLPNKVMRYLCFGLVSTILLLIFSLVRASRNENHRLVNGLVMKRPPPPPVWESYPFLTRYYGGIRNLVSFQRNVPEYPRPEDELPIDKLAFVNFTHSDEPGEPEKRDIPPSKVFVDHPKSVFKMSPEAISECFLDAEKKLRVPPIRYYDGRPNGFPEPALGSYELLNINEDICYERYGRYGPYGLGYSQRSGGLGIGEHGERQGAESTWEKVPQVDWRAMDWADAQRRCFQANADRYKPLPKRNPPPHGYFVDDTSVSSTLLARDAPQAPGDAGKKPAVGAPKGAAADEKLKADAFKGTLAEEKLKAEAPKGAAAEEKLKADAAKGAATSEGQPKDDATKDKAVNKLPRTAVVVRCWDEFWFRQEDIMNVRSLITELSLASGGRYDVHLLVQVKNDAMYPIWADAETYERRIRDRIPAEFQGLVTLWTETQMLSLYQGIYDVYARGPDLPVHGVYRGLSMALQHFAYQHPEYDYYWQWEMDIRYTGHYYDLFSKVENWAKEQPRKGLWERGGRFYVPSVHGTWEDFKQMARVQTEMGTAGADNIWAGVPKGKKKPPAPGRGGTFVWGPQRPKEEGDWFEADNDPVPPTAMDRDKYVWGVGEDADYITFNPMFDPEGTTWGLADDITGYNTTREKPPRRANIITASRLSRRLLMTMHRETAFKKHFAFPEMWPATAALHHGYKAVYVPHPLYVDREWPTAVLAQTLNNGKDGATGGSRTSVFGDREHNLRGLSWFYDSGFSPNLYRRWLGLKVNNDGGEEFELTADPSKDGTTVGKMRGGEGRMCLPPVLLHPVKDVDLPVEELINDDAEVPESDPAA